jgi:hypothetical protein
MEDRSKRSTSVGVIANLRRRDSYSPEHGSWNPLSFAKSLRRRHKDFFPLDVSTSVLYKHADSSPGERCSQKM